MLQRWSSLPGSGEPQGVLGSSLLVLENRRVCWGLHFWSWRAAGCAGVLTPGPGEPQGVLGSSLLVLESHRVGLVLVFTLISATNSDSRNQVR